jgi:scyllo-inositol 2-dehydrogenase (NADP+)
MISVLVLTHDPAPDQHPLVQGLRAHPALDVSIAAHLNGTERTRRGKAPADALAPGAVVVALLEPGDARGNLSAEHEALLLDHLRTGGGLVVVGATLAAWAGHPSLLAALGNPTRTHTPLAELIATPTLADPLTRRLDPFAITDRADLLHDLDPDAVALLTTSWHFQPRTLAYRLPVGAGTAIVMPLGQERAAWEQPALVQFALRATLAAGGQVEAARPVHVAMIGYGAIGQAHGTAISQVPELHYALVCDRLPTRLAEAQRVFPLVRTCADMADVATDPDIDAVIISTPPNSHAAIARQFLEAGKHVILEKPFCLTRAEADELIALAEHQQRALTVYQCRRWDPDFLAIQETIASGAIGEIFHLEAFIGGFDHPCHYWHSDAEISGGAIFDWGSHYLDWILQLVPDPVTQVRGTEHKRVWHDVTNADQTTVHLRFAGGQEATLVQSDIAAALKPKWYILGTRGAIVAEWRHTTVQTRAWSGDLEEAHLAPSEALPIVTVHERAANGTISARTLALPPPPPFAFHRNFADHLHLGMPLAVSPASARRNVIVMEAARHSAANEGAIQNIEI